MQTRYERQSFQFLSFYRFVSYALAVMFTQLTSDVGEFITQDQLIIILTALGIYTLLRVFSPLRWREQGVITYVLLIGDFLLCALIVLLTNGLDSIFLLYALTPIMTAALFFEEVVALTLAAVFTIELSVGYLVQAPFNRPGSFQTEGQNITLLIVYTLFCFVSAMVPYRINLNIRRRIERDAIIEERRRIGREIHDGIAQTISYLGLKIKLVSEAVSNQKEAKALHDLEEMVQITQATYEDIRESIDQLSIETMNLPLLKTLADYIENYRIKNKIRINYSVIGPVRHISPLAELQLFRVAQEALTNVRRHAVASEIDIRLQNHGKYIEMVIKDNGKGFDMQSAREGDQGYHGLSIIRERIEGIGGTVNITSEPGKGTEITVNLPTEKVRI